MTEEPAGVVYRFGPFQVEPAEKSLRRDGRGVPVTPKVFDTLLALVEQRGRLVTKDDLMARVWPNLFVEEANLAQNISVLRKILGEGAQESPYIETVPKRGYRFVASVTVVEHDSPVQSLEQPVGDSPRKSGAGWARIGAPAMAVIAAVGATAYFAWPVSTPPEQRVLLAVLPFANLTGDEANEYLSAGLTDEVITQLGRLEPRRLGVLARTSAPHYEKAGLGLDGSGRKVTTGYLLEGGLRRDGDRLRVTVRLTRLPEQSLVWTDAYEQGSVDTVPVQLRVARAVAAEIQSRLSLPPIAVPFWSPTDNAEAYAVYRQANYYWNKRTPEMATKALALYQRAVTLDPKFALAYAEMSMCYLSTPMSTARESFLHAQAMAMKALEIDDSLGNAHFALGRAALHLFDWTTATRAFRRAEVLEPSLKSHDFMLIFGRFEEAMAETRRELEADPVKLLARHGAGIIAFYARDYGQAIDHYQKALELDPHYVYSQVRLGQAYTQVGRYDEAIAVLNEAGVLGLSPLAYLYAIAGRTAEAHDVLRRMHEWTPTGLGLDRALVYTALGDKDLAFHWLDAAYEERSYQLIYLMVDPRLDPLRGDPRYADLVRRIGFPEG